MWDAYNLVVAPQTLLIGGWSKKYTYTRAHPHVHTCTCMYICTHTYTHTRTHVFMQAAHATGRAGPEAFVRWASDAVMLSQSKVALRAIRKGCEQWPSSAQVRTTVCMCVCVCVGV